MEFIGTLILILGIQVALEKKNRLLQSQDIYGIMMIAATITFVGFAGILRYAGINPAREFGPRIFGAMVYGKEAFIAYTWVPIVAPLCASPVAVYMYEYAIEKMYND